MFSEVAEIALVAARFGQFQQLLKTRVILILNFTRPHAITYTNNQATPENNFLIVDNLIQQAPVKPSKFSHVQRRQCKTNLLYINCNSDVLAVPKLQSTEHHQKPKIKIGHLNIRWLKNRDHLLQLRILVRDNDFNIFSVSETWLKSTVINAEVEIMGYKLSRQDRPKKGGGGVCVYTKALLKVKVLKDLSSVSATVFTNCGYRSNINMKSILLCATYKPPECPIISFTDDFSDNYMKALSFGKDVFILGDLNCNLLKNCPEGNALNDLCATLNLKQLVMSPARVTENSSSLIDVILASNIALVIDTMVMETHISDHFLIYSVLTLKSPKTPPNYIKSRTLKNCNAESFLLDLQAQQVAWTENYVITDASKKLDYFNQVFLDILEKHGPIKLIKLKQRNCAFLDEDTRDLMIGRYQLLKIARETKSPCNWELYRASRKHVKTRPREAEMNFVQNELQQCKKNSSKWKVIRNCVPRKESTEPAYSRDLKTLADEFNAFFTSVGAKAAADSASLLVNSDFNDISSSFSAQQLYPDSEEFQFRAVSCKKSGK